MRVSNVPHGKCFLCHYGASVSWQPRESPKADTWRKQLFTRKPVSLMMPRSQDL